MNKPFLSVVIPVYNESQRLQGLDKIISYLKKQEYKSELILVNDGSSDNTLKKIKELAKGKKFKIISYDKNRGKGFAVRTGFQNATGKYHLFMDIDLSTPIEEFEKFIPFLEKFDIVIATRKKKGAKLNTRQPKLREGLGRYFTLLSQKALGLHISDFTCGFKCFSSKASEQIFSRLTINRWSFDCETMYIAKKRGLTVKEVAVTWTNNPHTRVKFPQAIFNSLAELIKIRLNGLRGIYN